MASIVRYDSVKRVAASGYLGIVVIVCSVKQKKYRKYFTDKRYSVCGIVDYARQEQDAIEWAAKMQAKADVEKLDYYRLHRRSDSNDCLKVPDIRLHPVKNSTPAVRFNYYLRSKATKVSFYSVAITSNNVGFAWRQVVAKKILTENKPKRLYWYKKYLSLQPSFDDIYLQHKDIFEYRKARGLFV